MHTAAEPNPLPSPPSDCNSLELEPAITSAGEVAAELGGGIELSLFHVGGLPVGASGHPLLHILRRSHARYRFDDPRSEYLVWYGSRTATGAFLEVFGDTPGRLVTPAQRFGRVAGSVTVENDVRLLDLQAPAVLGVQRGPTRLDDRIGTVGVYSLTQAWSRRFFDCDDQLGGLVYRSRLAGSEGPNFAIFEPRTVAKLNPKDAGVSVEDGSFDVARAVLLDAAGVAWG
jgi:hypothetical protein